MARELIRRPDFSNSLVHLTRHTIKWVPDEDKRDGFPARKPVLACSAFEILKKILTEGRLIGSGNDGYVKGRQRAVCMSEIPLSNVQFFTEHAEGRYSPYGVAMSKASVFAAGGRPVIYIPDNEAGWIPDDEKWRQVRFELPAIDFTHEREWRLRGDLNLKDIPDLFVLVWSLEEANEIRALNPLDNIRAVIPMEHFNKML